VVAGVPAKRVRELVSGQVANDDRPIYHSQGSQM
jgi:hypothetical protein